MRDNMFEDTVRYTSPSHGDWGVVRIASLVPESYALFVCPFACGRHGALGAIQQGFKNRLSYIYITQEDIIEGYDDTIIQGVDELLSRLEERPKAIMVFVSCLDDLIGTDLDALMETLHGRHPDVTFRAGHMNPITLDTKSPPPVTIQDTMYSFLEPAGETDDAVNLLGNLEAVDPRSELFRVLKGMGIKRVRHISDYKTFADFQQMAKSSYNIVLSPAGTAAARHIEQKHGIPFFALPVSYDIDKIQEQYEKLASVLGGETGGLRDEILCAKNEITRTRKELEDTPVAISSSAVVKPFELACALKKYGFRVAAVMAQEVLPIDREGFEQIGGDRDIRIIQPEHPDVIRFENRMPEAVAIGFDAAYITGSRHIVNLSGDQRMFGYHGVRMLMEQMRGALHTESDLKELLEEYGVVV